MNIEIGWHARVGAALFKSCHQMNIEIGWPAHVGAVLSKVGLEKVCSKDLSMSF